MDRISKGARPFVDIPDEVHDITDYIRETAEKIVEEKTGIDPKTFFQSTPRRMSDKEYCEIRSHFANIQSRLIEDQAKMEAAKPIKFEFDPLEKLHTICENKAKDFSSRITDKLLRRYCGLCFFGAVDGFLGGIPLCKECLENITGKENPSFEEMSKITDQVQKFSMRNRDAFELLYMKLAEEKTEDKDAQ